VDVLLADVEQARSLYPSRRAMLQSCRAWRQHAETMAGRLEHL
jgi:hypothetical protein